jgi:hypothetical protein
MISSISPSAVSAGANTFLLTIDGTQFNGRSIVLWNGAPRPTIVVSSSKLQARISGTDVSVAKTVSVSAMDARTVIAFNEIFDQGISY